MQVQEIMRPNVHMADPNMTIREAARRMRANNIGALPVGDNDRRAAASREYYRGLRGAAQSREHAAETSGPATTSAVSRRAPTTAIRSINRSGGRDSRGYPKYYER